MGAQATAEQIALSSVQIRAIRADPKWRGGDYYDAEPGDGPHVGLAIARGIGQISYRSELELDGALRARTTRKARTRCSGVGTRSSRTSTTTARSSQVASTPTPISRSREAMNHHDVGRGRGGIAPALARMQAKVTIAGMSSDRLYPIRLQQELGELIPSASAIIVVETISGHDGFLVEARAVGEIINRALADG